jgi:hypothetical protein
MPSLPLALERASAAPTGFLDHSPAIPLWRTGLRDFRDGDAAGVVTKSRHKTYGRQWGGRREVAVQAMGALIGACRSQLATYKSVQLRGRRSCGPAGVKSPARADLRSGCKVNVRQEGVAAPLHQTRLEAGKIATDGHAGVVTAAGDDVDEQLC